jgi:PmbA protein
MSAEELLAIAQRVAGQAQPGEQVEAFVERERETSVRVYEGEIEHLTSAQVEGVGVRVIKDGRVGFAYSGTLDDASLAEVLAEARDNVAFGTTDEWAGLSVPDGVAPAPVELWRDALDGFATEDKVALAKELERLTVGLDPRLRVEDANYADVLGESAVATSTGIAASGRATGCYVSVSTMADDGDETQTGFGFSVGREPADLVLAKAAGDGADRALRMLGATKPTSRKVTVVLDPAVTAQFLGVLSATLNGEAVLKGRSLFAHRMGEEVAAPIVTLVDDATNVQAFSATPLDGEGLATWRSTLIDGGVLRGFVHNSYSGRRSGTASTGNATRGGFKSTPGCGCLALSLTPGTRPRAT